MATRKFDMILIFKALEKNGQQKEIFNRQFQ